MATASMPAQSGRRRFSTSSEPDQSIDNSDGARRHGEAGTSSRPGRRHDRERKIGHRRVDQTGQVTYKKKPTSELMATMQLGISHSLGSLASKPKRDILLTDFELVESRFHPREGSNLTPAHHYSDFRFKTYAPIAFRYFRDLFGIQPDDFLLSMCNEPMMELSNPGASGSIFYITEDDEFIVKTVQHNEADFLQKLLPGYYMNLNQNPRTLLPKFYGLFCYQCGGKNIRFTVMNNILPSTIKMHEKYDLKGSTYKRRASKHERKKNTPTYKDLDFLELHPEGLMLEADTYTALVKTIERDCRVLQSFKIMDYSLLIGVHNLDKDVKEREQAEISGEDGAGPAASATPDVASPRRNDLNRSMSRGRSVKQRVAQYSTAMESIQAHAEPLELDNEDIPHGGIPARNSRGERLLLYLAIIDVLQSYRLRKRLEHAMKSMVHDGDTVSVHRPGYYASRFQQFFADKVFRKIPSLDQPQIKGPHMRFKKLVQLVVATNAMKHSPTKKRSTVSRPHFVTTDSQVHQIPSGSDPGSLGAVGGRPDLLPKTTPPPFYEPGGRRSPYNNTEGGLDAAASQSSLLSPGHSVTDSVPTLTENTMGTQSYTASSPSCSSDVLDTRSVPSTTESTRKSYSLIAQHSTAASPQGAEAGDASITDAQSVGPSRKLDFFQPAAHNLQNDTVVTELGARSQDQTSTNKADSSASPHNTHSLSVVYEHSEASRSIADASSISLVIMSDEVSTTSSRHQATSEEYVTASSEIDDTNAGISLNESIAICNSGDEEEVENNCEPTSKTYVS